MRILTVRHVSTYRYAKPVELGEHWMMFRPREGHSLRLVNARLIITPVPKTIRWLHDVFDNSVAVASFTGRTQELRFDSTVTIEQTESPDLDYPLAESARSFPFDYSADDRANLDRALERRHNSKEVRDWAASFVPEGKPTRTMDLLRAMTLGVKKQFKYLRRVERGVQTPEQTLKLGSGTCRDFALLMIEAVRALGLAARFVSGYIFVPEAQPSQAIGGGATHAWLQIYLPGAGWVDFDPTNSIVGNRNLIQVAVAWEPAHALPLWGTFIGSAASFLGLEVTVSVVDETGPPITTSKELPSWTSASATS